ncbi:MAG: TatD family hydrolase [Nitrososphaerota archaeon]|jgi:predicted metal-dependent TIM-barrel fold hydrolase|nr:TatD family hydrolase [Nitrososphaerota archaeon]MDG6930137.1 TatD family hydrolase [Nitrososphaerota archaeon]MDG6931576.1 TatD family hydrolase [Nitrososphaerota archaeon]MDG6936006.1 TatD family hydrolase [Nitrososphaerota archaeon]MDG6943940.1 TatD family hydrolase [Nitrososphaerota archaeon]
MQWIDSHSHHYLTSLSTLEELHRGGLSGAVEASWIPVRPSSSSTLIDLYSWVVNQEKVRLSKIGVKPVAAIGIHPRCIPTSEVEQSLNNVEMWLQMDDVKALGEVGLESGDDTEVYVLERQLRLAMAADKPVIMHTPRIDKKNVLKKILSTVETVSFPQEMLVIDHLNSEVYDMVRGLKTYFGLSVQPGKLSVDEAFELVQKLDFERVLINSDSSTEPSQPDWPALVLNKLERSELNEIPRKIAVENPQKFYRI